MESSNIDCLSSINSHLTSILNLNPLFSILLSQISLFQPQFSFFNSSSSILSQKYGIFDSKCPQNSVISDKMSTSATCTACSFFPVRVRPGPTSRFFSSVFLLFFIPYTNIQEHQRLPVFVFFQLSTT